MSVIDELKSLPDISFIENETLENVLNKLKYYYESKYEKITGEHMELEDSDPDKLKLDAIGQILYQIMVYIDFTGKQNLIKYSTGAFLDHLSANLQVIRKKGKAAKVFVRFSLSSPQESVYTVPEGTRCSTEDDTFFRTVKNEEIPVGDTYIDIECICTEVGEIGNDYAPGEINTLVDLLPYVQSVCNISSSYGGEDEESDDSLAERYYLAPSSFNGWGGEPYYTRYLKEFSTMIGDAYAVSPEPCYTNISFIMRDGTIPDDDTINAAQKYLDEKCRREICDVVTVRKPELQEFQIDVTYYINESDRKNSTKIQEDVEDAIENYRKWQTEKFGRDINPAQLYFYVMKAGVKRLEISEPSDFQPVDKSVLPYNTSINLVYGGIEDD